MMGSEIQSIKPRHRAMMEALVVHGKPAAQVAIEFDISESRLSILRRSKLWKIEEDALCKGTTELAKNELSGLLKRAVERERELLESADGRLAHAVIKDIFNRTGVVGQEIVAEGGALIRVVLDD